MESLLWQTVFGLLTALGGGGLIVLGLSNWLGKVWAERLGEQLKASNTQALERIKADFLREVESYKVKLKKSEFLFQKEFEAASEFVALKRSFLPTYSHPDMDWYEACDEIAHDFHKIETALGAYLSKHGAVLKSEVKDILSLSIGIAGENKFEITSPNVPSYANKAADELYNKLKNAEESLLLQVHSQAST